MFRFKCSCCEEWHDGMPSFAKAEPLHLHSIPSEERQQRCLLSSDACVIDQSSFFVRGCLEIPVIGVDEPFVWGVWVSLSEASFATYCEHYDEPVRAHVGPFFAWLSSALPYDPQTAGLKTQFHLRDGLIRPSIELEPTDHPLAVEQRNGISVDRLAEIYASVMHRHH